MIGLYSTTEHRSPASGGERDGTRRRDRGSALVVSAILVASLLGVSALAVDLGMMYTARGEAQRAADAGALAGAAQLIYRPSDAEGARDTARSVAALNNVRWAAPDIRPEDVTVDLDSGKVTVTVIRSSERENPVSMLLGPVLGFDAVDVTATATARVTSAMAADCPLPLAVSDRWVETTGDNDFDAGEDYYDGSDADELGDNRYTLEDVGTQITIKPAGGSSSSFEPGWWYLYNPKQDGSASELKDWIDTCPDPDVKFTIGENSDDIIDKNGNNQSIVNHFDKLIKEDPNAYHAGGGVIEGSDYAVSPRVKALPLFDPSSYQKVTDSRANFDFVGFAGVFIEDIEPGPNGQKVVEGVLVAFQGSVGTNNNLDTMVRTVRLVN